MKICLKEKKLDNKSKDRWQALAVLLLFSIFFFLRLYKLGYHDLWYDEICTIGYAKYPWGNWNAPLYWIILHFWIKIFGISEFSLRFPSLIFSFLSVILVFLLGKKLFGKQAGIIASIFIGLSPFHLWYAQEARDYSLALFFGTISSYLLFKAIKKNKFILWLSFILTSVAGFYTNYFYIFLFIAHILYFLLSRKNRFNFKEIIYFLIIGLSFSFYLPRFLSKFNTVWGGFWIPKPTGRSLLITLENFVLGYSGSPFLYLISNILIALCFISGLLLIIRNKDLRANFIFSIFLFCFPIFSAFYFSKIFFSVYLDRGLIIFSPYLYLVLALGLVSFNKHIRIILLTLLVSLLFIGDWRYFKDQMIEPYEHHTGSFLKKPFKPILRFIEDEFEEGDFVSVTNINPPVVPSLLFYSRRVRDYRFFFDPKFNDPNWQQPIYENQFCVPFYKINGLLFKRLWIISCDGGFRSGNLDENSLIVKEWCDKNLRLEFSKEFDGLWLFRYVKNL